MSNLPLSGSSVQLPAWVEEAVVAEALASSRLVLCRGYLHEVNNALAGIGTLVEALEPQDLESSASSLRLIGNASAKAVQLEHRLRPLYVSNEGTELSSGIVLNDFLPQNKDLMELMLTRDQKFSLYLPEATTVLNFTTGLLWKFLLLGLYWARLKATSALDLRLIRAQEGVALSFELAAATPNSTNASELERLERAMETLSHKHEVGFINSRGALLLALGKFLVK